MISNIKIRLLILLVFAGFAANAQDAAFSQYHSSLLYLNPAFSGEERDLELSANYRTQWKTVSIPYQTSQLSAIIPIYNGAAKNNHLGGIGVSIYTDNAGSGELKTIGGSLSLAKLVRLTKDEQNTLSFGLQIGGIQRTINYSKLTWGEQYQPFLGYNANIVPKEISSDLEDRTFFLDISSGLVYYYNDIQEYENAEWSGHLGVSGYHLNTPDESFSNTQKSQLPSIFKFHAGIDIPLSPFLYIAPGALVMLQGNRSHLNGGLRFIYNVHNKASNVFLDKIRISAGLSGRLRDSFIYSVGLGNKVFEIGYSYDMNAGGIGSFVNRVGASEISLIIRNPVNHLFNKVDTPRI